MAEGGKAKKDDKVVEEHPHKVHQPFMHRLREVGDQMLYDLRNPKPKKKKKDKK